MCKVLIIVAVSLCKQLKVHLIVIRIFWSGGQLTPEISTRIQIYCLLRMKRKAELQFNTQNNMSNLRGATDETKSDSPYDYDLAVIGGGSGGMAAAKEAARNGARVRFSK